MTISKRAKLRSKIAKRTGTAYFQPRFLGAEIFMPLNEFGVAEGDRKFESEEHISEVTGVNELQTQQCNENMTRYPTIQDKEHVWNFV